MRAAIASRPVSLTRSAAGSGSAAAASLAATKHSRPDNQRGQAARGDGSEGGSGDYEEDEQALVAEMASGAERTHADGAAPHGRVSVGAGCMESHSAPRILWEGVGGVTVRFT